MTVVHNASTSGNLDHPSFSRDGVCLSTRSEGGATVVSVAGELDAFNIHHLSDYAEHCLSGRQPVILDLTTVGFLGAQGIQALLDIDQKCQATGVPWALVPSRPVSRLLRVCDKDGQLPAAASISHALQECSAPTKPRRLLQLVTESS